MKSMKPRKSKAIRSTVKMTAEQWAQLADRDKRKHTSHYKRVPDTYVARFIEIDGHPHKMVNGVLVPLKLKAVRS